MKHRFLGSISEIEASSWNDLLSCSYPFVQHQYLSALESSGCVGGNSGWTPCHLVLEESGQLVAALPLYEKSHSYGEYVFDWTWADAFHRYGRPYFPKLVSAIPFTPVTGPRLLICKDSCPEEILPQITQAIEQLCKARGYSSWHLLFPDNRLRGTVENVDRLMRREAVQFHWMNREPISGNSYRDFDHFLQGFRSSKRKQIRRERRKVEEQGLKLERRTGSDIRDSDWQAFYACYQATYLKRSGHSGYLNTDFFQQIAQTLNHQCMLVTATLHDNPVASSLFFFDDKRLYGRYWGALSDFDCLHFEACYYQGIEFAIERGIQRFDPGTQGEHKLVRGFEPVKTYSYHWIADPEFSAAIDNFLEKGTPT
ncbi:MAG: GNAT family N-acetyltransferase [Porticoccaceae bacterium]